jgi:hypothetical protein
MHVKLMENLGFGAEIQQIKKGNCPMCHEPVDQSEFRDQASVKEFGISGMCQSCQDKIFGEE